MHPLALPTHRLPPFAALALALPCVALVGLLDWATGPVAMSLLYSVPIVAVAWLAGLWPGVLVAFASGASLLTVAIIQAEHPTAIAAWNSFTRSVMFLALGSFVALLRRDRDLLSRLNDQLQSAVDREAALARTDALTGLANGRSFRETLEREAARSRREGRPMALGCVDLDNFKRINDAFGHATGDAVLRRVAEALRGSVRAEDLVARTGGDEYVILVARPDGQACETIGERVLDKIRSIASDYPGTGFGATIGFAAFREPAAETDELLRRADGVMYGLKLRRKGAFEVTQF